MRGWTLGVSLGHSRQGNCRRVPRHDNCSVVIPALRPAARRRFVGDDFSSRWGVHHRCRRFPAGGFVRLGAHRGGEGRRRIDGAGDLFRRGPYHFLEPNPARLTAEFLDELIQRGAMT